MGDMVKGNSVPTGIRNQSDVLEQMGSPPNPKPPYSTILSSPQRLAFSTKVVPSNPHSIHSQFLLHSFLQVFWELCLFVLISFFVVVFLLCFFFYFEAKPLLCKPACLEFQTILPEPFQELRYQAYVSISNLPSNLVSSEDQKPKEKRKKRRRNRVKNQKEKRKQSWVKDYLKKEKERNERDMTELGFSKCEKGLETPLGQTWRGSTEKS